MVKNLPVDPRVRLAISRWPDDAPRGAVTSFCAEHNISRKTFYALLKRARTQGQAAALEPLSRRPHSSPSRIGDEAKQHALQVRAALEASGLDFGPISVFERMKAMGLTPPSEAALARIFREAGVARREPKKKPRAAYRRFVYPAPNACWQLDATEYVLAGGRKCVIFQLEDDHSRAAVASHVSWGETSEGALTVFKKGVAARGVPQKLLTDNGAALNPSRRGWIGQLVAYVTSLGVTPITGRPGKPTTQGKNERFHRTLFRWLDKQPLAGTLEELQAQVDRFDVTYNTQRPHQALPERMTPQQAWDLTPVAEPPMPPTGQPSPIILPGDESGPDGERERRRHTRQTDVEGECRRKVSARGQVGVLGIKFNLGTGYAGVHVFVTIEPDVLRFFSERTGELIHEAIRPGPGVTHVGNGRPLGRPARARPGVLPMS